MGLLVSVSTVSFPSQCPQPPSLLSVHSSFSSHLQGCLNRIDRLFSILESYGLKPNLESFAVALECMGRNQSSPKAILR